MIDYDDDESDVWHYKGTLACELLMKVFFSSELKKRPNLKEIKTKQFSKLPKAKRASTKKPINTSSVLSECVGEYHYELHIETWFSYVSKIGYFTIPPIVRYCTEICVRKISPRS